MIIWNTQDETWLAASPPGKGINNPEQIELVTILRCLQIYVGMVIHNLVLKSDCLFMILECQSRIHMYSGMGSLVAEIKNMQAQFEDCPLQHTH